MKSIALPRWSSLAVWALVAASAAFWGLRLFVPAKPVPPQAASVGGAQALRGDPLRVLGEPAAGAPAPVAVAPAAGARFKLLGVVAPPAAQAAAEGLALIAVDGKPAKAYRVGALVDGELVLQRVHLRGAELGARGARTPALALDLARLPPPATGSLPTAGAARPGTPPPAARPLPMPPPPPADEDAADAEAEAAPAPPSIQPRPIPPQPVEPPADEGLGEAEQDTPAPPAVRPRPGMTTL